jgi:hypothetical protein
MTSLSTETSAAAREELELEDFAAQVDNTDFSKSEHVNQAFFNSIEISEYAEDSELSALRLKISTSLLRSAWHLGDS